MATSELEWLALWGDPEDGARYFTLDEINEALGACDELRAVTEPGGELAALLGLHPPSLFAYANDMAEQLNRRMELGLVGDAEDAIATMWVDGLVFGILLALAASGR